jgi:hypothetical protein
MADELPGELHGLDRYEIAYLFGGVPRVVMVALVGLHSAGRVEVTVYRPRVTVLDRRADDPIQREVLGLVPDGGRQLTHVVQKMAESAPLDEIVTALQERDLLRRRPRRWQHPLTRQARRAGEKLLDDPPAEHRLAVLGARAVDDKDLRRIFQDYSGSATGFGPDLGGYNAPNRALDAPGWDSGSGGGAGGD